MTPINERFVRWEATTIQQFGFVNNLLVALSTATLGFGFVQRHTTPYERWHRLGADGTWADYFNNPLNLLDIAMLAVLVSLACGLICAISRLLDFRGTAQIARGNMNQQEKAALREEVAGLGKFSWGLLYAQVGSFFFGASLLIVGVARQL
jgi:hypothetical protein